MKGLAMNRVASSLSAAALVVLASGWTAGASSTHTPDIVLQQADGTPVPLAAYEGSAARRRATHRAFRPSRHRAGPGRDRQGLRRRNRGRRAPAQSLSGFIDAGGNQYLLGAPPGKRTWTVGIKDPDVRGRVMGVVETTSSIRGRCSRRLNP